MTAPYWRFTTTHTGSASTLIFCMNLQNLMFFLDRQNLMFYLDLHNISI